MLHANSMSFATCRSTIARSAMSCSPELVTLLSRLGLERHVPLFEEEAITELTLLTSMGKDMLCENLDELGLVAADVAKLSTALFPEEEEEDDGPALEDNDDDDDDGPQLEANAPPAQAEAVAEEPVSQEQLAEAATDVDWMDKPLATLDLAETKRRFLAAREEALAFHRHGQLANAAAAYTRALALEVPNPKANASVLYNRAACCQGLGQLHQAQRDAQLAAEADPTLVGAWWRAAEAALLLGDTTSAAEAVASGLKAEPQCAPLLELQRRVQAAA